MRPAISGLRFGASCIIFVALAITTLSSVAQRHFDEAQMREMMEQGQKMQECMQGIDPSVMETMQREGQAFASKIDALCAAGKRDEAQDQAMAYGKEIAASSEFKQVRKCGEMMRGVSMESQIPMPEDLEKGLHVCD